MLDASALLAYLLREPGRERVLAAIEANAVVASINFAEVASVYVRQGAPEAEVRSLHAGLPFRLVPVDDQLALRAALLAASTRPAGLSLGDRVCLALARDREIPVLTADRAWAGVAQAAGETVELIR